MTDFFKQLLDALPIALVALPAGWLGSFFQSYFQEKGRNLATKEDISVITSEIEAVKNKFSSLSYKSTAYIDRQIKAFDDISSELSEIKSRLNIETWGEALLPDSIRPEVLNRFLHSKSLYIESLAGKHSAFISKGIANKIYRLAESMLETALGENINAILNGEDISHVYNLIKEIEGIIADIRDEILQSPSSE